jgi:hypothetical protein
MTKTGPTVQVGSCGNQPAHESLFNRRLRVLSPAVCTYEPTPSGLDNGLPALLFERLWQEVGCRAVLEDLAGQRQFAFAAERGTFLTVLHRLFVSGSDRAAEKWRADYRIEGTEGLQLHHLYRAMAWLGEPLTDQTGASGLVPRCRKDLVEEELFTRRRDLFAELSVVFMDTTSLSFRGKGR